MANALWEIDCVPALVGDELAIHVDNELALQRITHGALMHQSDS